MIRGGNSPLTAHVAVPALEVMAADPQEGLLYSHCGGELGAELRTARDRFWQQNEPLRPLMWVCRAIPVDLLSHSHLQCLAAGEPLLEGRRLALHTNRHGEEKEESSE